MESETLSLLIWLAPLLLLAGAVAGVLAGLLGVGGGIVIVPALYHIFSYLEIEPDIRMHLAVGTSLATIIPTSLRSVRAHHARGSFDQALFTAWVPGIVIGVLIGTWLANRAGFDVLTLVFATVALIVSLYMAIGNINWKLSNGLPANPGNSIIASFVGAISAMMGIGGGTLSVPILNLFGIPIHRSVGTAAGFGLVIAIPATLGLIIGGWNNPLLPAFSFGYVNWLGFILIVPATQLTVPIGVKLAHSLSQKNLRRAFALFLGVTSIRMFADIISLSS
ncbi:MAG: sulfite exporter TauE/SafE family protein [Gammaproteobacteria bacterium]|nr:sulfite exporter TauE/SafE family protein [Gammaproteobacteria bacterium]MCP4090540.1 sulfite exporter TauE/SafE family protein [Gammaproteobacteria bacterium]MCP4276595.1 sulfite exporter TauE/SafE family protein [Gammaproteobacteria bacterium]MCP4831339.1 sulfite exporter TauE/SafE family protein [Gammaproteobacteria bacterium]MCP4928729.1 sulfite exporter TauE/SafE family protein [Gammaproteobacteria bacterium]